MLNIMACGAVANIAESNQAVQQFQAETSCFSHIYAYTQSDFQPSLSFPFCQKLMVNFFIHGRDSVHTVLQDSQSLGSHTSVMEFTASSPSNPSAQPNFYAWSHAAKSPMGIRVKPQCKCKRMESIRITTTENPYTVTHRCTAKLCQDTNVYTLPAGASWVGNPPSKSPQGAWFVMPWIISAKEITNMDTD